MAKYFITGATGFIGRDLIPELLAAGHELYCLSRTAPPGHDETGLLHWIRGDLHDPESYRASLQGAEYVIHLAALLHGRRREEYFHVNAGGTEALLKACVESGAPLKRFVHMSSIAAMGPVRTGRLLRESNPCRPTTEYGKSKLCAEKVALNARRSFPVCILRPSFVYGKADRRGAAYLRSLLLGTISPLMGIIDVISICHVSDVVKSCLCAVGAVIGTDEAFIISDPAAYRWTDIADVTEEVLVSRPECSARERTEIRGVCRRARRKADRARRAGSLSWGCDTTKAAGLLGFQPVISLRDGLRDALQAYLDAGLLAGIAGHAAKSTYTRRTITHEAFTRT